MATHKLKLRPQTAARRFMDRKKQLLGMALPLLLLGVMLFFLLRDAELSRLAEISRNVDVRFLLAGVAAMVVFFCCEALGLRFLLNGARRGLSHPRCYAYSLIDFYFSSITPACCGGQPAQLCYMQRDGVSPGAAAPALLSFNLIYHVAVLLVAGGALLFSGGLPADMHIARYLLIYGAAAQVFIGVVYTMAIFSKRLLPALVTALVRLMAKMHILRDVEKTRAKIDRQLADYRASAAYLREQPWQLLRTLPLLILHIAALYSLPYWVYRGFGLTEAGFFTLLATQAILTLAVESLPLPGGAGVTEGSFLLLYSSVFGPELVLPALLLIRGLNYYLPLFVGGLTAALLRPRRQKALHRRPRLARRQAGLRA